MKIKLYFRVLIIAQFWVLFGFSYANQDLFEKGRDYYYGMTQKQSFIKAKEFFQRSAEEGNLDAMTALGIMYSEGKGVTRDDKKALKYLNDAAKKNHPKAIYILGVLNYQGIGVERNTDEAKELFKTAAELGNLDAQFSLYGLYNNDPESKLLADKWLISAADMGHAGAQFKLGEKLFLSKDYGDALISLNKGSNANDAANIYLSLIHLNGLTVRNNKALAMSIIGKVKDQEKIFQYANKFLNKKEDLNHQFALNLFRILRDRGNLDAYLAIANMYERGLAVKKDLKRAYNFVIAAARKGHIPSQKKVVDMYIKGIGTQKSKFKSVYWLKKLIQSGDLEAKERLSSLKKG